MTALISLTYDDALPVHRTDVAPALSALGLHGTFYVPAATDDLHAHIPEWRAVAAAGHELGNHTCWHPCRGQPTWLDPSYHLTSYNRRRIRDEIAMADRVLRLVDGRTVRSFAASCGNLTCGPGEGESFVDDLRPYACAVRAGHDQQPLIGRPPFVIPAVHGDGKTADYLIAACEPLLAQPDGWLVVLFHGVGADTHGLHILPAEHLRFVTWIAAQRERLSAVPVAEAVARRSA